jgi:hypothetical protein
MNDAYEDLTRISILGSVQPGRGTRKYHFNIPFYATHQITYNIPIKAIESTNANCMVMDAMQMRFIVSYHNFGDRNEPNAINTFEFIKNPIKCSEIWHHKIGRTKLSQEPHHFGKHRILLIPTPTIIISHIIINRMDLQRSAVQQQQ